MVTGAEDSGLRLRAFRVEKLFGEFDHFIPLNVDERVTALIGPNGLGKTACLRLISGLFRNQWSLFAGTQFASVEFTFTDGRRILITKHGSDDSSTEVSDALGIVLEIFDPAGNVEVNWVPRSMDENAIRPVRFEQFLPFLTRTGPRSWTHDMSGVSYNAQEVIEAFGKLLPDPIASGLRHSPPKLLDEITGSIDCHLIETQRLLVFQSDDMRRAGGTSSLAISRKAQLLKSIISKELADYASTSQSLDRSFPRRVLENAAMIPPADLSSQLADLDAQRQALTEVGILDEEEEPGLPQISLSDSAIASVLSVYVTDTRRKLSVLAKLQSKIQLFVDLIDERFVPKYVEVNKVKGFSVKRKSDVEVPLEKLSSGEQHQLVLFFELLFELKGNSLILIDEPELSLHVGWQRKFISDLKKIIDLNCFDVVLATHSPQLIGAWEDLVIELGDVDPQ